MKIIAVRHGETDMNAEGRVQGLMNTPINRLNATGKIQMQPVATMLPVQIDAIFSSPLRRAYESALIIAFYRKTIVTIAHELRERDFGSLEGLLANEVREEILTHDYKRWGGDSLRERENELAQFVNSLLPRYENPVFVTHAGVIRMLYILYAPDRVPEKITNASLHEFEV